MTPLQITINKVICDFFVFWICFLFLQIITPSTDVDGSVQFKLVSVRSEKPIFALTSSEKFPQRHLSCEKHKSVRRCLQGGLNNVLKRPNQGN